MHVCGSGFGVEPCAKHANKPGPTLINEVIPVMEFVLGVWPPSVFPFITAFNHTVKSGPPLRIKTKSPQAWTD